MMRDNNELTRYFVVSFLPESDYVTFGTFYRKSVCLSSVVCRVAMGTDIHGYIHVWISDLVHTVDISMHMDIPFNSN